MNTFVQATVLSLNLLVHTKSSTSAVWGAVQRGTMWLGTSPTAPRSSEPQPGCPGATYRALAPSEQGGEKWGTIFSLGGSIHYS